MTEQRVRAVKLASELGLGIIMIQGLMHDLGIAAPNGASWIGPKDAARVRKWFDDERQRMADVRATLTHRENAAALDRYHDMRMQRRQPNNLPAPKFACACCGRNVGSPSPELIELGADLYCPVCLPHYELPDEPAERELERLQANDEDLRGYARKAWAAQLGYRDRMKAAYRSRDTRRAVFAEVVLQHEPGADGSCVTCHQPSPCPVWTALEQTNQGIFREMEKLSGFDDDDLELALHPERLADRDFGDLPL